MLSLTLPALTAEFGLSRAEAGALISATAAGQIVGGIVFGYVSDRLGRVRTAFLCILIYSIFSGLIGFAPSAWWLGVLRFCGALGMGGTWTAGAALVAESWGPQLRGRGGALMQMDLPCGAILAIAAPAVVGAINGNLEHAGWRTLYFLGALPAVVLFFVMRRTPESSVWLARRTAGAGGTARVTRTAMSREDLRNAALAFAFIFFLQYVFWGVFNWTPTFLATVKHFNFLRSLPYVLSPQLGAMSGFLVFAALVDRLGRRPMFMSYICIGIVTVSACLFGPAPTLIIAIFFTGFSVNGIFAGMGPFIAELIPDTSARGFIMGLLYNGGRIGGFLAPSVIGLLASGHNVVGSVYVQARSMYRADGPEALRSVGEVEFANGAAAQCASGTYGPARACAGIVGFADLQEGENVRPVLEALLGAGNGRLRGIRNTTAAHPDPSVRSNPRPPPEGLLLTDGFRRGTALVGRMGLSLDVWAYHTQLAEVAALARACPDTPVVVDHCGGPLGIGPYRERRAEVLAEWRASMRVLASLPNVAVKLGGRAMRVGGFAFDAERGRRARFAWPRPGAPTPTR